MHQVNEQRTQQDAAVIIDYENLYYSVTQFYTGYPNLEQIIEAAEKYGRVASCQAFADWSQFQRSLSSLLRAGIQPVFCPSISTDPNQSQEKKSSVDPTMCVHAMKLLYTCPNIGTLILVTGDRDFIPLVLEARQMGRRIVVLGEGRSMSTDLAALADDVILYRDIVEGLNVKEPSSEKIRVSKTEDPFPILVDVVKEARKQGKPTTLGYLKLRMKDRIKGFDETTLEDENKKKLKRFKDFVSEAIKKGLVKLHTTDSANEVLLPEEDPAECSYFSRKTESENQSISQKAEKSKGNGAYQIPSVDFVKTIRKILSAEKKSLAFTRIKQTLTDYKKQGKLLITHSEIDSALKSCIHYELLSGEKLKGVIYYALAEDCNRKLDNLHSSKESSNSDVSITSQTKNKTLKKIPSKKSTS